jgi:hypothetical protein
MHKKQLYKWMDRAAENSLRFVDSINLPHSSAVSAAQILNCDHLACRPQSLDVERKGNKAIVLTPQGPIPFRDLRVSAALSLNLMLLILAFS